MLHFSRFSADFGPLRAKIRTLITKAAEQFETYGSLPSRKPIFLMDVTNTGNGNGERGTGNGERGTGNREQESGN